MKQSARLFFWVAVILLGTAAVLHGAEGVVVEAVEKSSAGEKAGILVGDLILSWEQPAKPGLALKPVQQNIRSILDWMYLESEYAPRGPIRLRGTRNGQSQVFDLPAGAFGTKVHPVMAKDISLLYESGKGGLAKKAFPETISFWRKASDTLTKKGDWPAAFWLLIELGIALAATDPKDDALAAFRDALRLAETANHPFAKATAYHATGTLLIQKRDLAGAENAYIKAVEALGEKPGETLNLAKIYHALGVVAFNQQKFPAAREASLKGLAIREKLAPDSQDTATSFNTLGVISSRLGDLKAAEDYYRRAIPLWEKNAPDSLNLAQSLNNLGNIIANRGDLKAAEEYHRKALEVREKVVPESLDYAMSLNNLGVIATKQGRLALASEYYEKALAIREKLAPGGSEVVSTLSNLGIIATLRGDLDAAEAFHKRALEIEQRTGPETMSASLILNNLGTVVQNKGDLKTAEEYFKRSLAIKHKINPKHPSVAEVLDNLGNVCNQRGDFITAESYFRESIALKEKSSPGSVELGQSLNDFALVAYHRGDMETAEDYHNQARTIFAKHAPESNQMAASLTNLGAIAADRKDYETAERYYRQAFDILEKIAPKSLDVSNAWLNLGDVAAARSQFSIAEECYRRALDQMEKLAAGSLDHGLILSHFADLAEKKGDWTAAADTYAKALTIVQKLAPGSHREANVLHGLGKVEAARNKLEPAADYFRRALESLETQVKRLGGSQETKAVFRARFEKISKDYIDILIRMKRADDAFQVLERSRAQLFLALLVERDLVFSLDIPEELERVIKSANRDYDRTQKNLSEWTADKGDAEIEKLTAELRRLREKRAGLENQLLQTSAKLASLVYPQPLDLAGVQSVLDPGTLILSYSLGTDNAYLFVVAAKKPLRVIKLKKTGTELRSDVERFLSLIQRGRSDPKQLDPLLRLGSELYGTLIRPAENDIARSQNLLILPDGALHVLPFGALVRSAKAKEGRYLIEWKPIHKAMSATVYTELKKARERAVAAPPEQRLWTAFGDPDYSALGAGEPKDVKNPVVRSWSARGMNIEPLPASRQEVMKIAGLFRGSSDIYLGDKATEEQAKALGKDRTYIHFACHGLLDESFPLNSGLVLTLPISGEEGRENGILQAWEIFERMRIDAGLVVLSACQTGLGKEMGGEGLVGLTRAFLYAGAQSVVASLWEVADVTTAELMKAFYSNLQAGKSKAEALKAAAIGFIRRPLQIEDPPGAFRTFDASHPFFWAAFELFGNR